jgi:hypothetical protein
MLLHLSTSPLRDSRVRFLIHGLKLGRHKRLIANTILAQDQFIMHAFGRHERNGPEHSRRVAQTMRGIFYEGSALEPRSRALCARKMNGSQ